MFKLRQCYSELFPVINSSRHLLKYCFRGEIIRSCYSTFVVNYPRRRKVSYPKLYYCHKHFNLINVENYSTLGVSLVSQNDTKLEQYFKNINSDILSSTFNLSLPRDQIVFDLFKDKEILEDNLKQLESLKCYEGNSKDAEEISELIEEDLKKYKSELQETYKKIINCLIPKEDFEECNDIVLEITAGVGGVEAMLFAEDLRRMYYGFLDFKGWIYSLAENDESELGGVRHCSLLVSGAGVYSTLRHEAGVHRVQRVPATERSGRMHTSTVTVAVLPQPSDIEVKLQEGDLKIETKKASGAGGQHVNTTESAVRITHIPTGIKVECQSERSQTQNKAIALKRLQAKIYERELTQIDSNTRSQRKSQVGTSSRSEKIRSYNYRDDRISDHRMSINLHNLKDFMSGGEQLDKLLHLLDRWSYERRVLHFINSLPT